MNSLPKELIAIIQGYKRSMELEIARLKKLHSFLLEELADIEAELDLAECYAKGKHERGICRHELSPIRQWLYARKYNCPNSAPLNEVKERFWHKQLEVDEVVRRLFEDFEIKL